MSDTRTLHPDWPPFEVGVGRWVLPAPTDDLAYALGGGTYGTAESLSKPADVITLGQVERVIRYDVSYHGAEWTAPDSGGSELDMVLVAELTDGRWISVEAWNDYTGWGCQDGSEVRVGATEDDVVWHGLTQEGRRRLGYPEVTP